MVSSDHRLKVCTINCWGLKYIAKDRDARIAAIARYFANSDYDIVANQELWVHADYEHVRSAVAKSLPYSKFFYSGALGSGLAFYSRWPILATTVNPYSLNGSPIDVLGGDWFVGKAAVSILLDHPTLGHLQVFNTHLFAKGGETGPEWLRAHRLINAYEIAKLARQAALLGRHVVAMGDFNSTPGSIAIKLIHEHTGFSSAWDVVHPHSGDASPLPDLTPERAIRDFGITADNPINTYANQTPHGYVREHWGKRLDYVFFRPPLRRPAAPEKHKALACTRATVVLTDHVPGTTHSYSDHFGLEAEFNVVDVEPEAASEDAWGTGTGGTEKGPMMSPETLDETVRALMTAYRHSRETARKYLTIFAGSIAALVVLCVGSAWLPVSWINPVLVLVIIALAWLGTTMLYVGFIYGNWEEKALMNVVEELEVLRNAGEAF